MKLLRQINLWLFPKYKVVFTPNAEPITGNGKMYTHAGILDFITKNLPNGGMDLHMKKGILPTEILDEAIRTNNVRVVGSNHFEKRFFISPNFQNEIKNPTITRIIK